MSNEERKQINKDLFERQLMTYEELSRFEIGAADAELIQTSVNIRSNFKVATLSRETWVEACREGGEGLMRLAQIINSELGIEVE